MIDAFQDCFTSGGLRCLNWTDFTDRLNRNLTGKLLKTLLRAASKFKVSLALKLIQFLIMPESHKIKVSFWTLHTYVFDIIPADSCLRAVSCPCTTFWTWMMSVWRLQYPKSGMELFSTNCDSSVHYRVRWIVLQNCESLFITTRHDLLQNATGITRCVETQTAKWPQYIDSIFCDYLIISHNSTELPWKVLIFN